jgi:hypothetical protein
MVTESQRHITELLSDVVPLLKHEGFRKSRHDWTRERDGKVQCINVQTMRGGWGFFINLGVIWPGIAELCNGFPPDMKHPAVTATLQERLEMINRNSGMPYDQSARGLAQQVEFLALPWLDARLDPPVCAESTFGSYRAAFQIEAGDLDGARETYAAFKAETEATEPEMRQGMERLLADTRGVLERAALI